jgi:hypothetical protein
MSTAQRILGIPETAVEPGAPARLTAAQRILGMGAPAESTVPQSPIPQARAEAARVAAQTPAEVDRLARENALIARVGSDVQRLATPLERGMDAMQVPARAVRGFTASAITRRNPIKGAAAAVRAKTTTSDLLTHPFFDTPNGQGLRFVLGLGGDLASDPLTYATFGGLTGAGRLAKAATTELRLAELGRDADRLTDATAAIGKTGEWVEGLGNQARAGHRVMAGVTIPKVGTLPVAPRAVQGILGDVAQTVGTGVRKTLGPVLQTWAPLTGVERDVFRMRFNQIGGSQRLADLESSRELGPVMQDIGQKVKELGLDPAEARQGLMDYAERAMPAGWNPRDYMTPEEIAKYDRWTKEATATANVATPEYAVNTGKPTMVYQGDRTAAGELVVTPPGPQAGTIVGPANIRGSVDFRTTAGTAPNEISSYLPENSYKALRRIENRAMERARAKLLPNSELLPEAERMQQAWAPMRDRNLADMKAEGVPIEEFNRASTTGQQSSLEYVPHVGTPSFQTAVAEEGARTGFGRRLITEKIPAQKHRQFVFPEGHPLAGTPLSANEVNRLGAEVDALGRGNLSITGYKPVTRVFMDDPAVAMAYGNRAAAKSIESSRMLNDYARTFGKTPADAVKRTEMLKQGWRPVSNELEGVGDKVLFPPHIAKALGTMMDPGVTFTGWLGKATRAYDSGIRAWKGLTLPLFLNYHARNEVDDLFRATMYGGLNPSHLGESAHLMTNPKATTIVRGKTYTGQELFDKSLLHGATDTGMVGEVAQEVSPIHGLSPRNPADALMESGVMKKAWQVGAGRENWTRFAVFLDRLHKGDSFEAAAAWSNKFLFDYPDVPGWVGGAGRRVFPFMNYTWHNTPMQFEMLAKRPGVVSGVEKARENASGDQPLGLPNAPLPGFLRRGLPLRSGGTPDNPTFWRLAGMLGSSDLNTPFELGQRANDLLTPFATTPYEMLANKDLFRGGDAEVYPGEAQNFLGLPASKRWALPLLSMLRPLTELDRMNPGNVFGTKEAGPAWDPDLTRSGKDVPGSSRALATVIGRPYAQDVERAQMGVKFDYAARRAELAKAHSRTNSAEEKKKIEEELKRLEKEPWKFPRR